MIVERSHSRIKVQDLVQADFLGFFQSCTTAENQFERWWPRLLIYASSVGTLEIFAKVGNSHGVKAIQDIFGVQTLAAFAEKLKVFSTSDSLKAYQQHNFPNRISFEQLLNYEEIARISRRS